MTIKINMIKEKKPWKIVEGDTLFLSGDRTNKLSIGDKIDIYADQHGINLCGQRLLVVEVSTEYDDGDPEAYYIKCMCNSCTDLNHDPHSYSIPDSELNNSYYRIFSDDSSNVNHINYDNDYFDIK